MSDQAAPPGGDDDAGLVKTIAESEAVKSWQHTIRTCMIILAVGQTRRGSSHDREAARRRLPLGVVVVLLSGASLALTHWHAWAALVRLVG